MSTAAPEPAAASPVASPATAPSGSPSGTADAARRLTPTESLLRFTTAGSVDDGKSTLIGRLLYDSKAVFEDQLASVQKSKVNRSGGPIDFSLLTDGLRAEREQGITIDVAYRYFATPHRKFIIADTPGHEQYTRNMATGASTADAAVVLIDATKGVLRQSRRHAYITNLLGVKHIIAAVNKMDLVAFSQEVFERISQEFREFADQLDIRNVYAIPVSALEGDNVVRRSKRMPWFEGLPLLEFLETVPVSEAVADAPLRFPVQYVIRPDASFRGFAGQIASGELRPGTSVVALPSGVKSRIQSIVTFDDEVSLAGAGSSVNVTLENEIDLSRGDMLVGETQQPATGTEFEATLVWMYSEPLDPHKIYLLKHTTRTVRARVSQIRYRVDINTLEHHPAAKLDMNDIAAVDVKTTLPLFFDPYRANRTTGSFILIDPLTNATVAAGIIERGMQAAASRPGAAAQNRHSTKEERILRFGHPSGAIWLRGRPHVAELVERRLFDEGWHVQLAGPNDFLAHELATVAKAFRLSGHITIFSPLDDGTDQKQIVRAIFGPDSFFAVRIDDLTDEQSSDKIVTILRKWRDTHSDPGEKVMTDSALLQNFDTLSAEDAIDRVLAENKGEPCITCSYQAEDMIVLDLLRKRLPDIPVLFLDTGYHFAETYAYRDRMIKSWNLNARDLVAKQSVAAQEAQFGILNRTEPGKCCQLRKVEPLFAALQDYDVWFTGLRREQSPTRKNLKIAEHHELPTGKVLLKVSPLAAWTWGQVWKYTAENKIDFLPLYDLGYRSIGCEPCTAIPAEGADPRSGRWGGAKLECGIHTESKRADG